MNTHFNEALKSAKKIAIFSHISPDADALCSSFALKNIIKNNFDYKYVDVFIDGDIGELYAPILRDEVINPKPYINYDVAFVLDCPNTKRTGRFDNMIQGIGEVINIDHHETNEKFGTINLVVPKLSSTCEIVYLVAKAQGYELNNVIAKELYQGIITDTNCFTSLSISKKTHQVVSELLGYKFDHEAIKEYYFKNNSKTKTKLLSKALQSMKFYNNSKFTTMKICNKIFGELNASFEDTLGIIDNGININGTEVSAILIEKKPGFIYCSLRSKGAINVGEIAKKFNGGGGQKLAAFQATGDIKEIEKKLAETVLEILPYSEEEKEIIF